MTGNTLYKRIEQGYKENYCDGTYTFELVRVNNYEDCDYLLRYTYKTGEMIEITVRLTKWGEVLFYSPVHQYNYSNFNNHVKSVINVCRMLFDLIESNKDAMIEYYGVESTIETSTEQEIEPTGTSVEFTSEDGIPLECGIEFEQETESTGTTLKSDIYNYKGKYLNRSENGTILVNGYVAFLEDDNTAKIFAKRVLLRKLRDGWYLLTGVEPDGTSSQMATKYLDVALDRLGVLAKYAESEVNP